MKIERRETKENGVVQITTLDERWYSKQLDDGTWQDNPSITWIGHYSPMGYGLLKFYADRGMDEAEMVKKAAGEKGSKVHQAIELLLMGNTIKLDYGFMNPETKQLEEMTPDEYFAVMTFAHFWEDYNSEHVVKLIDTEKALWVDPIDEKYGYAGTRDFKVLEDGKPRIWDIKTSKDIYLSHELQLSALKHADPELPETSIIQVAYARNKNGYKATEIEDKYPLFQSAKRFWFDANPEAKPKQKDYPPEITLAIKAVEDSKVVKIKNKQHA